MTPRVQARGPRSTGIARALVTLAASAVVAACGPSSDHGAGHSAPATAPAAPSSASAPPAAAAPAAPAASATGASPTAPVSAGPAPTDPVALRGKATFDAKCVVCHTIAGGDGAGPDLHGITKFLGEAWIARWLRDPAPMLATDPHAKAQLAKYKVPMPNPELTEEQIRELIAYFAWADATIPGAPAAPAHDHSGHTHKH